MLRVRDFRWLLAGTVARDSLGPFQFISLIFWLQEQAPPELRVLLVGLLGTARGAGMLCFGLVGGAFADRFDRRRLLLAVEAANLAVGIGVALALWLGGGGPASIALVLIGVMGTASLLGMDGPTRMALVPDLVGPMRAPAAISLLTASLQLVSPLSILASGFAVDSFGFAGAYAIALLGPLVDLAALSRISRRAVRVAVRRSQPLLRATFADVRAGFAYARRERVVFWAIALVLATYALGFPAVANLGPTWVTTVVGVPYRFFGLVATTWGIGGLLAGLLLTRYAHVEHKGALLVAGALGFGASFTLFAFGRSAAGATLGNFGLGLSVATVQISSIALLQRLAPDAIRGRVMSLLQLGMGTAQLITLPIAALGQWIGLELLFPALALAQLATVGSIALLRPALRRARG